MRAGKECDLERNWGEVVLVMHNDGSIPGSGVHSSESHYDRRSQCSRSFFTLISSEVTLEQADARRSRRSVQTVIR